MSLSRWTMAFSSHAGVERANELGMDVVITDHHLPGDCLPPAVAIVNPNQPGDTFPSKHLAGVGVVFYVLLALRAHLNDLGWFSDSRPYPNMSRYLDLVALGTVADMVPLDKNNRILVAQGLNRMRAGQLCFGISALLTVAGKSLDALTAADLGFGVGPRLNAAGRLEDMSVGIACLLSDTSTKAMRLASQLDTLNKERRRIEWDMKQEAFEAVDQLELSDALPDGVCVYRSHWHQGVVGLVAARVKERVHRPVIAFARESSGGQLKGSARSIPGLHIRDVLEAVAVKHPGLIVKFGGHAMAAGLSLAESDYEKFSAVFAEVVSERTTPEMLQGRIETDGALEPEWFTLETAELLTQAVPWGQRFPEPLFNGNFELVDHRIVGKHHLKLTLRLPNSEHTVDGIAFNVDRSAWPNYNCHSVVVVYRLAVNAFNGRRSLQLVVDRVQPG